MRIENTKFCYHCGVLTDADHCPICGSYNSMRRLFDYITGTATIPDRLYHMKVAEIQNYIHISSFGICNYCHTILKKGERCACSKISKGD